MIEYLTMFGALALLWPRGYVLIYLIDRSKGMSFGFKFFAGWLLGIAGFTLDVFAASVFGGLALGPWVFFASSVTQIFGFSFMIFIFERRLLYPHFNRFVPFIRTQLARLKQWTTWEKIIFVVFISTLVWRVAGAWWSVTQIPTYDFDAWNNWNLRAKVIYSQGGIPLDPSQPYYLGGGIKSYPLNDSLLKVWLATAAGSFADRFINVTSIVYYLLLVAIFYFALPTTIGRLLKFGATYALSSLPFVVLHAQVPYVDLLFSIFVFVVVAGIFFHLTGSGNSFYYLSLIYLGLATWTKNEGLVILFPLVLVTSLVLVASKKLSLKDFFLSWFFSILTAGPWLYFRFSRGLDFLSGDSSTLQLVFNSQFLGDMFSSIFLRSHFIFLWLVIAAIIVLRLKDVWESPGLGYVFLSLVSLFAIYNGVILFTDKALDLSALVRANMHLAPLAVFFVVLSLKRIFAKIE